MDAGQLFPTCREGYRLKKNPEKANENVAFLSSNAYRDTTSPPRLKWRQMNGDGEFIITDFSASWKVGSSTFGGWEMLSRSTPAQEAPATTATYKHQHENPTGELYVRLGCHTGVNPGGDGTYYPLFSITDDGDAEPNFKVGAVLKGKYTDTLVTLMITYKDGDGAERVITIPEFMHAPSGPGSYRNFYDMRIYIPGRAENKPARVTLEFMRGASAPLVEVVLAGTEGKGFNDKAGLKHMSWFSDRADGKQGMAPLGFGRLGIGNKIHEALP